jgi:3',5'-cyclic-AMP phosphodiesterase
MSIRRHASLFGSVLAILAACSRPGDKRAARELEVGHAVVSAVAIDVDDGAAAVRELRDGGLRLWAGTPSFVAHLRTGAERRAWRIDIENVLPDAVLEVSGVPTVTPVGADAAPTERAYEIELPADTDVTLALVPRDPPSGPFRFLAMGDVQDAIDRVEDIFGKMNEVEGARFVLFVGDQTEQGTSEQLERFRRELKALSIPCYMTLGNHELGADDPPRYYDFFGRASHSFVFGETAFTLVDSGSATIDPLVDEMLDEWLSRHRDRLHVIGMHIPPIDPVGVRNGAFASRTEAQRLLEKLARGGVDLTLYGHVHSYYAFDNADIPAFITGGGGAIPERFDGIGRHFLSVLADPARSTFDVGLIRVDIDD